ncbi:MAG TPA: hypothetical protein VHG08_15070 [Longimicrobium sp.]|nr:hypothetical protein [Longimicrobium sp.]
MKTYKVVQFTPKLAGGVFSNTGEPIGTQVENAIREQAAAGWEFVSYQTVHALVNPGCLASLLGRKAEVVYYDVMIFSK